MGAISMLVDVFSVLSVRPRQDKPGGKQQGSKELQHKSESFGAEWRPWGKSIRVALRRVLVPAH